MSHAEALKVAHDERRPFCFVIRYPHGMSVHPYYFDRMGSP